jgi:pyrimidine-specific ribonucleoside hydrolase
MEKPELSIIIDTDCSIDDLRAISLLLSRSEISIKGIVISDGSVSPVDGYRKIRSLLIEFDSDSIPVACGELHPGDAPPWRDFNRQISWGKQSAVGTCRESATELLNQEAGDASQKIVLVCLGPLTTIGRIITENQTIQAGIERIVWYTASARPLSGFNYEYDRKNADIVLNSGTRIDLISNLNKEISVFDTALYNTTLNTNTKLGEILRYVHSQEIVSERLVRNHFRLFDDLVALYLTNPELFDMTISMSVSKIRYTRDYNASAIREVYSDMIKGIYIAGHNVVFTRFPIQRELFRYDVREIMDTAIARYGSEEWKANVMTDEFHGHLGVFSIVGAKMGIKARELFDVGPDVLEVVSYAGSVPPYSCLNDGIQVSTGATLGMGTIRVIADSIAFPSALFMYNERSIRLTLKREYLEKVDADIRDGILTFGLADDGYWKLIRRNALVYWTEWNRDEIFHIEEVTLP